jgi:L-2-hydroxyglutarate oxidase
VADVVVAGAGIVGLAVAARLVHDGHQVTVVDKEPGVARHQTGRNSGVIHSGIYYEPGSLKARLAAAGSVSMKAYAAEHGIPVATTGKLIVATTPAQVEGLHRLADRAEANGVPATMLGPEAAREHEPHVRCTAGLWVEPTGVVDYGQVCQALASDVATAGQICLSTTLVGAVDTGRHVSVSIRGPHGEQELRADMLVACAGLHADRVARACGLRPAARILPFRGEYVELTPAAANLVNGLVYPVPDPRFPFLGVHLTRALDGRVHAGPNAVLALAREGYTWGDVDVHDVVDTLAWPGLWRLASLYLIPGAQEMVRSLSPRLFARSVAALLPGITQRT